MVNRETIERLNDALKSGDLSAERRVALKAVVETGSFSGAARKLKRHHETVRKHVISTLSHSDNLAESVIA
jgi:hypothetical protein